MNETLRKYLNTLDNSDFDQTHKFDIDKELRKIRDELINLGEKDSAMLAQLEMEIYSFTKRIEEGRLKLTYNFAGTRKDEEGNEKPFEWPDSKVYEKKDYDYILSRFKETENHYCKGEYGFVLILGDRSPYKDNKTVLELIESIFIIAESYLKKIKSNPKDDKHYGLYFINNIEYIFYLAKQRYKQDPNIESIYKKIKEYIYEVLCSWNLEYEWSLRAVGNLTQLIVENFDEFKDFDLKDALEKVWETSTDVTKKYVYGGIDLANIGDKFEIKVNGSRNERWLRLIAENYEKLAEGAKQKQDIIYISFIEDALKAYKEINDTKKIDELEKIFFENKSKTQGFRTATKFPEGFKEILKQAKDFIDNATKQDVINVLISTPMITKLSFIKEEYKKLYEVAPLTSLVTKTVVDKIGNTIAQYDYDNKDEIDYFNLIQSYDFHFQAAIREIAFLFFESIKAGKLSYETVINFISDTWLGKSFDRYYSGRIHQITILNVLKTSIEWIFNELNKGLKNSNYEMDLVMPIDSLTLKFDNIFRYLCENLKIPTYRDINKGKVLKEERSIYALLFDKKIEEIFKNGSLEDDLFFYKFILIEKAAVSWNLRNRVAHGLMDFDDYNYHQAMVLIILILKLSSYNFK